jgi:hypothetical protein
VAGGDPCVDRRRHADLTDELHYSGERVARAVDYPNVLYYKALWMKLAPLAPWPCSPFLIFH